MIHRADVLGRITADLKAQASDQIAVSKCSAQACPATRRSA